MANRFCETSCEDCKWSTWTAIGYSCVYFSRNHMGDDEAIIDPAQAATCKYMCKKG